MLNKTGAGIFLDEQAFIDNPADSFCIYQLKAGQDYHALRFAGLDELERDAEQFRVDVHRAIETSEESVFSDKGDAEAWLKSEGFTVIPNSDPDFITVRNQVRQEAIIYLRHGVDCCWTDGCDTRTLDQPVKKEHYNLIYTANLPANTNGDTNHILEQLYMRFNLAHPEDFHGHSLSVSDVVVLKQDGQVNSYYTDSFGFRKLLDFFIPDNPLKSAEESLEDDYGMIDGIINNGSKPDKVSGLEKPAGERMPKVYVRRHSVSPER